MLLLEAIERVCDEVCFGPHMPMLQFRRGSCMLLLQLMSHLITHAHAQLQSYLRHYDDDDDIFSAVDLFST